MKANVILTRSTEENNLLAEKISALGLNPILSPMLSHEIIDSDFSKFSSYTDIIVTSKFAAKIISQQYIYKVRAWVVGLESGMLLQLNHNINVAGIYNNLDEMITSLPKFIEARAIYFSGDYITQEIPFIDRYVVYNTKYNQKLTDETIGIIEQNKAHFIMVYSSNSVRNFVGLVQNYNILQKLKNSDVIAISYEVGKILKPYVRSMFYPELPNSEEMIKLLKFE